MPVSPDVEKELKSAEAVILEIKKILNSHRYTDEEYCRTYGAPRLIYHAPSACALG